MATLLELRSKVSKISGKNVDGMDLSTLLDIVIDMIDSTPIEQELRLEWISGSERRILRSIIGRIKHIVNAEDIPEEEPSVIMPFG